MSTNFPPPNMPPLLPPERWLDLAAEHGEETPLTAEISKKNRAAAAADIMRFRREHGLKYFSKEEDTTDWGEDDEEEHSEVLDVFHHIQLVGLDNRLHFAPLKKDQVKNALDIGTGTGIWAIDFADQYPDAQVVATDIAPPMPREQPPNIEFEVDDCNQTWSFPDNSMDFVHIRLMSGAIVDWNELFSEAYRVLRPGGWLESMEPVSVTYSEDGEVPADSAVGQLAPVFHAAGYGGMVFNIALDNQQNKAMKQAGFLETEECWEKYPIGNWPEDPKQKEIGKYSLLSMEKDFVGLTVFMGVLSGEWDEESMQALGVEMLREFRKGDYRTCYHQKYVWAQKPLD